MIRSALRLCTLPFLAIAAFMLITGMARADETLGWVGDLPVPSQALIDTQSSVNFDSPSGRVIQFTFQIALTEGDVMAFYQDALPELGWVLGAEGYERGNERMTIIKSAIQNSRAHTTYDVVVSPLK